jgi:hypothetical protein
MSCAVAMMRVDRCAVNDVTDQPFGAMSAPQVQQINASDLDLNQLAEVRRQLDQARDIITSSELFILNLSLPLSLSLSLGNHPSHQLVRATQTGSS